MAAREHASTRGRRGEGPWAAMMRASHSAQKEASRQIASKCVRRLGKISPDLVIYS